MAGGPTIKQSLALPLPPGPRGHRGSGSVKVAPSLHYTKAFWSSGVKHKHTQQDSVFSGNCRGKTRVGGPGHVVRSTRCLCREGDAQGLGNFTPSFSLTKHNEI